MQILHSYAILCGVSDSPVFSVGETLHVFSKSLDLYNAFYSQDSCKHTASTEMSDIHHTV